MWGFCIGYMWLYYCYIVKNYGLRKVVKKIRKNKFLFLFFKVNKYWIFYSRFIKYFISNKFLIFCRGSMSCWNRNKRVVFFLISFVMLGKCGKYF